MGIGPENPLGPENPVAQHAPGTWQPPPPLVPGPWEGAPLAGWWSRVGAVLLDGLIVFVPLALIFGGAVAVAQASDAGAAVTAGIGILAYLCGILFYAPYLMQRDGEHNGQTFGKQIVGIRVVRDAGEPFSLGSAFVREVLVKSLLFGFAGAFLFYIPTLLDWLWPLWDGENRALHDMVVSTHVVRV